MALIVLGQVPASSDTSRMRKTGEKERMVGIASMSVAVILVIALTVLALQVNWASRVADDAYVQYYDAALAVDSRGAIHIVGSYQKVLYTPIDGVIYVNNTDGRWQSEILSEGYPRGLCIAADSSDNMHIIYGFQNKSSSMTPSNWTLVYSTNSNGGWSKQILETQWYFHTISAGSIAIDKDDNVHICYSRTVCGPWQGGSTFDIETLVYATNIGGSWSYESLENSSSSSSWGCDIALEGGEFPRIAAKAASDGYVLYYSKSDSGVWSRERLDPGSMGLGARAVLEFDSESCANVFFTQYSSDIGDNVMFRAREVSGEWHYSEIASEHNDHLIPLDATSASLGAIYLHYGTYQNTLVVNHRLATIDGDEVSTKSIEAESGVSIAENMCMDRDGVTYVAAYGDHLVYLSDSIRISDRIEANLLWFLFGGLTIAVACAYGAYNLRVYSKTRP